MLPQGREKGSDVQVTYCTASKIWINLQVNKYQIERSKLCQTRKAESSEVLKIDLSTRLDENCEADPIVEKSGRRTTTQAA